MKKFLTVALAVMMLMTVVACRNTASEPTQVEEMTTEAVPEEATTTEAAVTESTEEATETATSMEATTEIEIATLAEGVVTYVTGEVSDAAMHSFNLTTEDGTVMEFAIADETVTTLENGLLEGETVTVGFTGDADSDSMTDRVVLTIADPE